MKYFYLQSVTILQLLFDKAHINKSISNKVTSYLLRVINESSFMNKSTRKPNMKKNENHILSPPQIILIIGDLICFYFMFFFTTGNPLSSNTWKGIACCLFIGFTVWFIVLTIQRKNKKIENEENKNNELLKIVKSNNELLKSISEFIDTQKNEEKSEPQ